MLNYLWQQPKHKPAFETIAQDESRFLGFANGACVCSWQLGVMWQCWYDYWGCSCPVVVVLWVRLCVPGAQQASSTTPTTC